MKPKYVDFLPIGTTVEIGIGKEKLTGLITGISIYSTGIRYQVVWWDGRDRKEEWLTVDEIITAGPAETMRVGFAAI